eukprot:CAMPEP_0117578700 /NCGR_PEP_ID=MMETSP0784-20121206/64175_1 /TAXON_ID=39447 /ORGANISM="" /LENGTH=56 /DNA_ID=CAMNT_0005378445 /DNA_START=37 /DNA_END=207 /DNA_ORIENTATION=-
MSLKQAHLANACLIPVGFSTCVAVLMQRRLRRRCSRYPNGDRVHASKAPHMHLRLA